MFLSNGTNSYKSFGTFCVHVCKFLWISFDVVIEQGALDISKAYAIGHVTANRNLHFKALCRMNIDPSSS